MRIALVTDVHFGPAATFEGKLRKLTNHAAALTEEFVDRVRSLDDPDAIANLGDVLEDLDAATDRSNYQRFVKLLNGAGCPVLHVAGNHDDVNLSVEDLAALWQLPSEARPGPDPVSYSVNIGWLHVTVLHSVERKDRDVRLPPAQLQWLQQDLAATTLPTLVLVHHPLSEMRLAGNRWFEKAPHICRVAERRQARKIIEESGRVLAVLNGHVHWNHFDVVSGIPYITLQSLIENLDDDAPGRPARAHALLEVTSRRLLVHVRGEEEQRYQVELDAAQRALVEAAQQSR